MPRNQWEGALRGIKSKAEKDDLQAISFLEKLETYDNALLKFKEGLQKFPVVNVKDALPNTKNVNQTFFLCCEGNKKWVFKPIEENNEGQQIAQAEFVASQLGSCMGFPIPCTVLLDVKGWTGSAQMYVKEGKNEAEVHGFRHSKQDLQKLVIFDLLFANSDRHIGNLLFRTIEPQLCEVIGIDHDQCLGIRKIQPLRLDYLGFSELEAPFEKEMDKLFSPKAVKQYAEIMKKYGIHQDQIDWMEVVAEKLNDAVSLSRNVCACADELINLYENHIWKF
jgi:hypothetical protein